MLTRQDEPPRTNVKVSIIVTTYNHERFAAQAVESVLAQRTSFNYEVLLADDCSTDGTLSILRRYERERPELVRVIVSCKNRGDQGMRFFGDVLRLCRGEFMAWLDGDDFWTSPEKLQVQADFLDAHPDFSMCFHDVQEVDETGERELGRTNPGRGLVEPTIDDLLHHNFVGSCAPMFRTVVLADLPEWYFEMPWGDWPAVVIAARHGRIAYLDRLMGVHRVHSGGSWSGLNRAQQRHQLIEFYVKLESILGPGYRGRLREHVFANYRKLASLYLARGDKAKALRCAVGLLRSKPVRAGALIAAWAANLPPRLLRWRAPS